MNNEDVIALLRPHATEKHQQFNVKLLPTVKPSQVLGVKMGQIRALAKSISEEDAAHFLRCVPHPFVELNILHMLLLNTITEPQQWRAQMEEFLPYLDNWMVTDAVSPALLTKKSLAKVGHSFVTDAAADWCSDSRPYVARLGIVIALLALQRGYLTSTLETSVIRTSGEQGDYYVHMAAAWFLATYYERAPEHVEHLLRSTTLATPVRLKAIQKIIESRKTSEAARRVMRELRTHIRS